MSPAVVEFHGFKDNSNRFIIKEFVIVHKNCKCQIVFDPPYSLNTLNRKMQKTAHWLSRRHHHIKWEERGLSYDENLIKLLCKPFSVLFTKGLEKTTFLREFHSDVRDIAQYHDIISTESTVVDDSKCMLIYHNDDSNAKCALRSAVHYYDCLIKAKINLKSDSF